jgi:hypothetical protein
MLNDIWGLIRFLLTLEDIFPLQEPSSGSAMQQAPFADITHEQLLEEMSERAYVFGWAFTESGPVDLSVRDRDGHPVEFDLKRLDSFDVYIHFVSRGIDTEFAQNAKFELSTSCVKDCLLIVSHGGTEIGKVPIQVRSNYQNAIRSNQNLFMYIENIHLLSNFSLLPRTSTLDGFRVQMLEKIVLVYRYFVPVLTLIALAGYLYLCLRMLLLRQFDRSWAVQSAYLGSVLVRLMLLALISAASFDTFKLNYVAPAYPLLVTFDILAAAWLAELFFKQQHPGPKVPE